MRTDGIETHPTLVWADDEINLRNFAQKHGSPQGDRYTQLADRISCDSDIGKDEAPMDSLELTSAQEAVLIRARSAAKEESSIFLKSVKALVKRVIGRQF